MSSLYFYAISVDLYEFFCGTKLNAGILVVLVFTLYGLVIWVNLGPVNGLLPHIALHDVQYMMYSGPIILYPIL